jgi:hypothetical protein
MKARAKLSNSAELCDLGFGYRSFDRFGLGLSVRRNSSPFRSGTQRRDAPVQRIIAIMTLTTDPLSLQARRSHPA